MAATVQDQEAWLSTALGRAIDVDKRYSLQCKDVIDDYCIKLWGNWVSTIRPGDAWQCFDGSNPDYFEKIKNNPNDPNQIPKRGDVIVWGKNSSVPFGHIAVVESATPDSVTVLQQDGTYDTKPTHRKTWGYEIAGAPVVGWLRPKLSEGSTDMIIGSDIGWRNRMNRFHHQLVTNGDMSDAVWKAVQGKELSKVLVEWSDHANASNLIKQQEIGEKAARENWEGQIKDLKAKLAGTASQDKLGRIKAIINE